MCNSHLVCTNWYTVWKKPSFFSVKSEEKLNPPLSPPLSFSTVLLFSKKSFTALLLFTKNPSAWKWTRKQDLPLSSQKTWERSRESFWQSYLPFWPQIISNIEVLGAKKMEESKFFTKMSSFCVTFGILIIYLSSATIFTPLLVVCWLIIVPWKVSSQNWQSFHCFLPDQLKICISTT